MSYESRRYGRVKAARTRRAKREVRKDALWARLLAVQPELSRHLSRAEAAALVWAWSAWERDHVYGPLGPPKLRVFIGPLGPPTTSDWSGFRIATLQGMVAKGLLHPYSQNNGGYWRLTPKGVRWARRLHDLLDLTRKD